jgi:hypothetical protein
MVNIQFTLFKQFYRMGKLHTGFVAGRLSSKLPNWARIYSVTIEIAVLPYQRIALGSNGRAWDNLLNHFANRRSEVLSGVDRLCKVRASESRLNFERRRESAGGDRSRDATLSH